jgi:hemerythrin superfamily protein
MATAYRTNPDYRPDRRESAKPSTGTIAGIAVAGAAAGLLLNLARKAAIQAPSALKGKDWDEALALEHAAVAKLLDAMIESDDDATARRTTHFLQVKHALLKHSVQEENVVYPALRDAGLTEGADELNHDHGYVKQYLFELENMDKAGPAFREKVREFKTLIMKHVDEEENVLYPKLKAQLSDEQNKKIAMSMNKEGLMVA